MIDFAFYSFPMDVAVFLHMSLFPLSCLLPGWTEFVVSFPLCYLFFHCFFIILVDGFVFWDGIKQFDESDLIIFTNLNETKSDTCKRYVIVIECVVLHIKWFLSRILLTNECWDYKRLMTE